MKAGATSRVAGPVAGRLVLLPERLDALLFSLPALGALLDAWAVAEDEGSEARLAAVVTVVSEPLAPLVQRIPRIADVVPNLTGLPTYQEAFVLSRAPGDPISGELARLRSLRRQGIPRRWGYGVRGSVGLGLPGLLMRWLLAPAVVPPSREKLRGRPPGEDFRELLDARAVPAPTRWIPELPVGEAAQSAARERLARAGIPAGTSPLVALIPGGRLAAPPRERAPRKNRWPWRRFVELAQELRRRVPGLRCVLVAGQEPLWPAVRIHEETARFVPLVGPNLDVADLAALLSVCDLVVGADEELLQLAAAVGAPTVSLFGPTDPRRAPRGDRHRCRLAPGEDLRSLETPPVLEGCLESLGARAAQSPE